MLTLTTRGAAVSLTAIFLAMWGAAALGEAWVGDPKPPDGQGGSQSTPREGTLPVEGPTLTPTVPPTVRPAPTRAARSRPGEVGRERATSLTRGTRLSCTCYVWTGNRTASGKWPRVGMAASNTYPFGTRLRVEGVGVVTVEDRIGHSSELDLYFTNRADCLRFGRRHLLVEVVR